MILNKLNQYKNLYLQASNENAHLKHAVSKHEDELEANRKTIDSMDSRILELEENQKEWDKEKAQLQSQRDCYKRNAMKSVSLILRLKRNWQKPRRK
ncbi:MAG: hypothetical protein ACLR50_15350 [Segatella copri]